MKIIILDRDGVINEDSDKFVKNVDEFIETVKNIAPTFGGINLEDIKAPECFEIETQLIEKMNIPVFHDDQHGTAIIASAAFLNAIEVTGRDIKKTKVAVSGAGAAAISCAKLFFELGLPRQNLIMCDSNGAIYKGRTVGMNKYKDEFALRKFWNTRSSIGWRARRAPMSQPASRCCICKMASQMPP